MLEYFWHHIKHSIIHNGHHSPLDQFKIVPIDGLKMSIFNMDISITNSTLMLFFITASLMLFLTMCISRKAIVPGKMQVVGEFIYNFTVGIVSSSIAPEKTKRFIPLIFSLFIFILFANALGMLPFSFTITSHIAVTFCLAAIVFCTTLTIGLIKNGPIGFFGAFVPHGIPKVLAPLMLVIEFFTYLARPFTLGVRLAVNMIAGHTMMKVIAGFAGGIGMLGILPISFNAILTGFEFFVAALQAYIFSILTCIYINDAMTH